jgi:hypothetical protein
VGSGANQKKDNRLRERSQSKGKKAERSRSVERKGKEVVQDSRSKALVQDSRSKVVVQEGPSSNVRAEEREMGLIFVRP